MHSPPRASLVCQPYQAYTLGRRHTLLLSTLLSSSFTGIEVQDNRLLTEFVSVVVTAIPVYYRGIVLFPGDGGNLYLLGDVPPATKKKGVRWARYPDV